MGRKLNIYYDEVFKLKQLYYYGGLSEKQQRHFLGMEYERLGEGSCLYLSKVFRCSRNRIITGRSELSAHEKTGLSINYERQRKAGGGAKKKSPRLLMP
jgi:hypothetical protein